MYAFCFVWGGLSRNTGARAWTLMGRDRRVSCSMPRRRSLPDGFWSDHCSRVATSCVQSIASFGPSVSDGATRPPRSSGRGAPGASAPWPGRRPPKENALSGLPSKRSCNRSGGNRRNVKRSWLRCVPNWSPPRERKKGGAEPAGSPYRRASAGDVSKLGHLTSRKFDCRRPRARDRQHASCRTPVPVADPTCDGYRERKSRPTSRDGVNSIDTSVSGGQPLAGLVRRSGGAARDGSQAVVALDTTGLGDRVRLSVGPHHGGRRDGLDDGSLLAHAVGALRTAAAAETGGRLGVPDRPHGSDR